VLYRATMSRGIRYGQCGVSNDWCRNGAENAKKKTAAFADRREGIQHAAPVMSPAS